MLGRFLEYKPTKPTEPCSAKNLTAVYNLAAADVILKTKNNENEYPGTNRNT
jgi:hypothetical protein